MVSKVLHQSPHAVTFYTCYFQFVEYLQLLVLVGQECYHYVANHLSLRQVFPIKVCRIVICVIDYILKSYSFTTRILPKLSTWCFEHPGDISCSQLVNPSHNDESGAGQNTCMYIYMYISL